MEKPLDAEKKMHQALLELKKYNHLRNDLDAYLYHLIEWALGEVEDKPLPEEYGIKEES